MTMLHVKLPESDKAEIQSAADALGLSASAFVRHAARQVIDEGELRLPLELRPSPALVAILQADDLEDDVVFDADSADHAAFLDSLA